ncbi:MAG: hypothetical protein IAF38_14495 [Bacteroidia bacterium]|nr:hypothetical protein [Bacteroidia bacterium]
MKPYIKSKICLFLIISFTELIIHTASAQTFQWGASGIKNKEQRQKEKEEKKAEKEKKDRLSKYSETDLQRVTDRNSYPDLKKDEKTIKDISDAYESYEKTAKNNAVYFSGFRKNDSIRSVIGAKYKEFWEIYELVKNAKEPFWEIYERNGRVLETFKKWAVSSYPDPESTASALLIKIAKEADAEMASDSGNWKMHHYTFDLSKADMIVSLADMLKGDIDANVTAL